MIHAIAIDDEPKALEIIQRHAERMPSLNLKAYFTDPFEALAYLNEQSINLVFLDINMPDISGLEFSKIIRKKEVLLVFTTAYSEYALESYEVEALDYLLKPFDFNRFFTAVSKAEERLKKPVNMARDFFFVNSGNQHHKICFEELNYIEGNGNYITYNMKTERVMVRSTMKEALNILPSSLFVQIQRSYIVSLKKIDKIQDNHVFIAEQRISIGAKYRDHFRSLLES